MVDNVPITAGSGTIIATEDVGGVHFQKFITADEAHAAARCRACTFATPGRAGTVGQKIMSLMNAAASTHIVVLNQITVDMVATVIKAVTVQPPTIRAYRVFTANAPTNGDIITKVLKDTAGASDANVVVRGDASAELTGSTTTLTTAIGAGALLAQEFAPRMITAAGYEMFDRTELLVDRNVIIRPGEGVVVILSYALATQNPTTDTWIASMDWYEFV